MLNVFKTNQNSELEQIDISQADQSSWIKLIKPSENEINQVIEMTGCPADFLTASLDENEHSRIELEDDFMLIIINVPFVVSKNKYDTIPIGIIFSEKVFITACLRDTKVLDYFDVENAKKFSTEKRAHFLFTLFLRNAEFYLKYMRFINNITDELELRLRKSMENKSLFQLFELERSLVYFITSLKDNNGVTERLLRLRKNEAVKSLMTISEDDEELLEDAIIENRQAIEMVEMHSNILSGMMDAFASIISNNLNIVMKFLTSITIILAIPTMIASFWGMNVDVPFKDHPGGFIYVVSIAFVVSLVSFWGLWKKDMF
jgi:magnesium transporter